MKISAENTTEKLRTLSHETWRGKKKKLHNRLVNKQILGKNISVSLCFQIT